MSCCSPPSNKSSSDKPIKHHDCPKSGGKCIQVPYSTVLQHIKKPWCLEFNKHTENTYYFCADPDCDVVYFTENDSLIDKSELRTLVGIKELKNDDAMACYCFDITLGEAKKNNKLKQFVVNKTKKNLCACESQNPSGRCCLKDFPKQR